MGRLLSLPVLMAVMVQMVFGLVWYDSHVFGDIFTAGLGKSAVSSDTLTLMYTVLSSFGIAYLMDIVLTATGTKDIGGAIQHGFILGLFVLGLLLFSHLATLGFSTTVLIVVLGQVVIGTILTGIILVKIKK